MNTQGPPSYYEQPKPSQPQLPVLGNVGTVTGSGFSTFDGKPPCLIDMNDNARASETPPAERPSQTFSPEPQLLNPQTSARADPTSFSDAPTEPSFQSLATQQAAVAAQPSNQQRLLMHSATTRSTPLDTMLLQSDLAALQSGIASLTLDSSSHNETEYNGSLKHGVMYPTQFMTPLGFSEGLPGAGPAITISFAEVCRAIGCLTIAGKRGDALSDLSRSRELIPDLAPLLWHSFGSVAALLREIVAVYPFLSPPALSPTASNRVCNALALLQCLASHPETRHKFVKANIPLFLFPFLNSVSTSRPMEFLRLTSLGVIGALVKGDDPRVVSFLLQTELVPLCFRMMEMGSELSKTVATFILEKVLTDELGRRYACATAERFYALSSVLGGMVVGLSKNPSSRLLKHIIKCYLLITQDDNAFEALKKCFPPPLRDGSLLHIMENDPITQQNLKLLLQKLNGVQGLQDASLTPDNLPDAQQKLPPQSNINNHSRNPPLIPHHFTVQHQNTVQAPPQQPQLSQQQAELLMLQQQLLHRQRLQHLGSPNFSSSNNEVNVSMQNNRNAAISGLMHFNPTGYNNSMAKPAKPDTEQNTAPTQRPPTHPNVKGQEPSSQGFCAS